MGENAVIAQEPTQSAGAVSRDVEGLDERCSADLTGGEDSWGERDEDSCAQTSEFSGPRREVVLGVAAGDRQLLTLRVWRMLVRHLLVGSENTEEWVGVFSPGPRG
jgi:hypothetical protein